MSFKLVTVNITIIIIIDNIVHNILCIYRMIQEIKLLQYYMYNIDRREGGRPYRLPY